MSSPTKEEIEYNLLASWQPFGPLFRLAWDTWSSGTLKPAHGTIGITQGPNGRYVAKGDCACFVGAALLDAEITRTGASKSPAEWLLSTPDGIKIGLVWGFDRRPFILAADPVAYAYGRRVRDYVESVFGPVGPNGPLNTEAGEPEAG